MNSVLPFCLSAFLPFCLSAFLLCSLQPDTGIYPPTYEAHQEGDDMLGRLVVMAADYKGAWAEGVSIQMFCFKEPLMTAQMNCRLQTGSMVGAATSSRETGCGNRFEMKSVGAGRWTFLPGFLNNGRKGLGVAALTISLSMRLAIRHSVFGFASESTVRFVSEF